MRNDGRGVDKLRKMIITRNYVKYAEGSCLIELGNTRVVCTASVEDNVPPFLKGTGTGWVTAEYGMIPRSCQNRISRDKTSGRTYEIQRLIGRSIRAVMETRAIGERTIRIDCDVIQADGGTRIASIVGGFIAMVYALDKIKRDGLIDSIPVTDFVAAASVGIVEATPILDLNYQEDSRAQVDMNVVMTGSGEYVEIQGTGESKTFNDKQLHELLSLANKGIKEMVSLQREQLKDILFFK
ncbi:MAG: ribonuclease PH [Candidatus Omnitrophota bacterium]